MIVKIDARDKVDHAIFWHALYKGHSMGGTLFEYTLWEAQYEGNLWQIQFIGVTMASI